MRPTEHRRQRHPSQTPTLCACWRRRQMALALAHPQQGSFRIAADRGLHQIMQDFQKPRLCLSRRPAAATRSPKRVC